MSYNFTNNICRNTKFEENVDIIYTVNWNQGFLTYSTRNGITKLIRINMIRCVTILSTSKISCLDIPVAEFFKLDCHHSLAKILAKS